jgi:hypothetical protein
MVKATTRLTKWGKVGLFLTLEAALCTAVVLIATEQRFLFSSYYAENTVTIYLENYKETYSALAWMAVLTFAQLVLLLLSWTSKLQSAKWVRITSFVLLAMSLSLLTVSSGRTPRWPVYKESRGNHFNAVPLENAL